MARERRVACVSYVRSGACHQRTTLCFPVRLTMALSLAASTSSALKGSGSGVRRSVRRAALRTPARCAADNEPARVSAAPSSSRRAVLLGASARVLSDQLAGLRLTWQRRAPQPRWRCPSSQPRRRALPRSWSSAASHPCPRRCGARRSGAGASELRASRRFQGVCGWLDGGNGETSGLPAACCGYCRARRRARPEEGGVARIQSCWR